MAVIITIIIAVTLVAMGVNVKIANIGFALLIMTLVLAVVSGGN